MRKTFITGFVASLLAVPAISVAGDAPMAIATKYGCLACHGVEAKIVGPGFKEVGAKYKGTADAEGTLAKKIRAGGVGTWGQIPMPPQAGPKDDELAAIVGWILAGAPAK